MSASSKEAKKRSQVMERLGLECEQLTAEAEQLQKQIQTSQTALDKVVLRCA
jgi:hypothetical protein